MSCPVLSISMTLRALALRMAVRRIALIGQKSSSKRAQFPLTMSWLPGHLALRCAGNSDARGSRGVLPLPRARAGGETDSPHTMACSARVPSRASPRQRNWRKTTQRARRGSRGKYLETGGLEFFPAGQRPGQGDLVGELEVGAHRDAARDAGHLDRGLALEEPRNVERGGFSLRRGIGRNDHLGHA